MTFKKTAKKVAMRAVALLLVVAAAVALVETQQVLQSDVGELF